jgi:hypothetical protein
LAPRASGVLRCASPKHLIKKQTNQIGVMPQKKKNKISILKYKLKKEKSKEIKNLRGPESHCRVVSEN